MNPLKIISAITLSTIGFAGHATSNISIMENKDFTTSFTVDKPAGTVFEAINRPANWWSEEITGETHNLQGIFNYHYRDVHISKMKIIESIPNKKVVWEVLENKFNFIEDQSEWVGTSIAFDISDADGKTKLTFTHHGLTPQDECFQICHDAWTQYIQNSLKNLIVTGKGQPNPKEGGFNEYLIKKNNLESSVTANYQVSFVTKKPAYEVFEAISSVEKWWTQNLEGKSRNQGDEFSVQFCDVHYSKHKLTTVIPDKKIVWLTTENKLNFVKDEQEWKGMEIVFDITPDASGTRVTFTQIGLEPTVECYEACSGAWNDYILGSLQNFINTGKGNPAPKD